MDIHRAKLEVLQANIEEIKGKIETAQLAGRSVSLELSEHLKEIIPIFEKLIEDAINSLFESKENLTNNEQELLTNWDSLKTKFEDIANELASAKDGDDQKSKFLNLARRIDKKILPMLGGKRNEEILPTHGKRHKLKRKKMMRPAKLSTPQQTKLQKVKVGKLEEVGTIVKMGKPDPVPTAAKGKTIKKLVLSPRQRKAKLRGTAAELKKAKGFSPSSKLRKEKLKRGVAESKRNVAKSKKVEKLVTSSKQSKAELKEAVDAFKELGFNLKSPFDSSSRKVYEAAATALLSPHGEITKSKAKKREEKMNTIKENHMKISAAIENIKKCETELNELDPDKTLRSPPGESDGYDTDLTD